MKSDAMVSSSIDCTGQYRVISIYAISIHTPRIHCTSMHYSQIALAILVMMAGVSHFQLQDVMANKTVLMVVMKQTVVSLLKILYEASKYYYSCESGPCHSLILVFMICRHYIPGSYHNCCGGFSHFVHLLSLSNHHHNHLLCMHICYQQTQTEIDQ